MNFVLGGRLSSQKRGPNSLLSFFAQNVSDMVIVEPTSQEETELAGWANDKLRGLLSPSDIAKLLSLLKVNNISSLLLLKSMTEEDLLKVS